jgi:hypothetical protein
MDVWMPFALASWLVDPQASSKARLRLDLQHDPEVPMRQRVERFM